MKIGQVVRKYRKQKQMTQEELAEYLGVTSSAVNKWENGYSLPDITLLAPIARVFGITTDTLLSYKEELTDAEITGILKRLGENAMIMDYPELFDWAEGILREYPNCDRLAAGIFPALDGYRTIVGGASPEHEERILKAYQRLLKSQDDDVVRTAAGFLFYGHLRREEYEQAEKALGYISKRETDHRIMRALLYKAQGEADASYRTYEELIQEGYRAINSAFNGMLSLASADGDQEKMNLIIEKQEKLAQLLEMGKYHENYLKLTSALEKRDPEEAVGILSELVSSIRNMREYQKSALYAHISFSNTNNSTKSTVFMLKQVFLNDEMIAFLKSAPGFEELQKELEALSEGKNL